MPGDKDSDCLLELIHSVTWLSASMCSAWWATCLIVENKSNHNAHI
jgi:hypothetical protein